MYLLVELFIYCERERTIVCKQATLSKVLEEVKYGRDWRKFDLEGCVLALEEDIPECVGTPDNWIQVSHLEEWL